MSNKKSSLENLLFLGAMWLDVRGYRKCLFDFVDEVTAHDLYKFSSTKTPNSN